MEQPPAKRHNSGHNPPPPTAEWVQTLARDHTDPQPLPVQSLTCTFKDGTKKVLSALLASEFMDWSVVRLMQSEGLTSTLSSKLKESAEILISGWKSSTEGYTAGSEVEGS